MGPRGYHFKIATADLAGWPSNLLLVAHRDLVQNRQ